jgi:hypothetical protein
MPDEIMFLAQGIEAAIAEMEATGIDASSAASGFHEHNLLDRKQGTLWKAGGTGNAWVKWDMGANYTASAIGIINGNPFTGGNASNKWRLQVETSVDWAFTSPVNRLAAQTPVAGDEPLGGHICRMCLSMFPRSERLFWARPTNPTCPTTGPDRCVAPMASM